MSDFIRIEKYIFIKTCDACPEQYDVLREHAAGDQYEIAYARLRHGSFTVQNEPLGEMIYQHTFKEPLGQFPDEKVRMKYLRKAIKKIDAYRETR